MAKIAEPCLQQLFLGARTYTKWKNQSVTLEILQDVYNLMKLGPTSANCTPLRILFLTSKEAKERLKPHLDPANVEKTMTAPVTALLAFDLKFYENFPYLYPFANVKA